MIGENKPLLGKSVAVPESRQLDVLAQMLTKRGAEVLRCPLVAIYDAPDSESIVAWIKKCIDLRYEDLILLTGEGLRRLCGVAKRYELDEPFINSLQQICLITRGPKPVQALKQIGLKPDIVAEQPTTEGVISTLEMMKLDGCSIAVQLYGSDPNSKLVNYLRSRNAQVETVAPYIYADDSDDAKVMELISEIVDLKIDAITFTSQAQLKRLIAVARRCGMEEALCDGLTKICVAAVGPVMAEALEKAGVQVDVMPESSYFMKPMVNELTNFLLKTG